MNPNQTDKGNGKQTTKESLARTTIKMAVDAWQNIVTGLGMQTRDKRLGGQMMVPYVAASREQFEYIFTGDDIAARVVELPSREMVREWIEVKVDDSDNDSGDQKTEQLEERLDLTRQVMQKLDTLKAKSMLFKALVWAKVHGGSLLFIGVDDGNADLSKPLDMNTVRTFDFLDVFDRWDVSINSHYPFGTKKAGSPETYMLQGSASGTSPIIHESRFIRFEGTLTSRQRMQENGGWSDSVYVRLEPVLRDFGIAWGGVAHLLQDFAQAVFKMRGLKDAIASDNDNLVLTRIAVMDMCRGIGRAIPIDSEDEAFERTVTPVSGLPELMDRFATRLAAAAEMPLTLLMGQSPAGLNATGESDITNWFNQISNRQETELRDPIEKLIETIWLSADGPTHGREPRSWSFTFLPLWQLDRKEEAEVRKMTAETDAIYIQAGVLDPDEVAQSRFGGDEYSTETTLDTQKREATKVSPEEINAAIANATAAMNAGQQPASLPAGEPAPAPDVGAEESVKATEALNGAQVQALVELAQNVQAGTLSRESAIAIILASFPVDEPTAQRIVPAEGSKPAPVAPPPGAAPVPAVEPEEEEPEEEDMNTDGFRADKIVKRGRKWLVMSSDGKKLLGEHDTEEAALKQLRAIEASKARA